MTGRRSSSRLMIRLKEISLYKKKGSFHYDIIVVAFSDRISSVTIYAQYFLFAIYGIIHSKYQLWRVFVYICIFNSKHLHILYVCIWIFDMNAIVIMRIVNSLDLSILYVLLYK